MMPDKLIIVWSDVAKGFVLGHSCFKRMLFFEGDRLVANEPYNEAKIWQWMREHKPIIDLTRGEEVPKDSLNIPPARLTLGRLEIRKLGIGEI